MNKNFELTGFQLKLIAIITMTLDHIGIFFLLPPTYYLFRIIGRLSFPIFAFLIAEGFNYTKNIKKYLVRLLIFSIISEPILDKCFYGTFFYYHSQNTLFQFLIALFSLNILQKIDNIYKKNFLRIFFKIIIIVFISILIYVCKIEYGILGFMMILSSYYFRQSLPKLVAALLACNFLYLDPLQAFGGLAILPIIFYKGKQTKKTGLWPYFYYPIHIIILYIILIIFGMNMNDQSISEQETLQITDTLSENNDSIVFDQETILFIGQLPLESNGITSIYSDIELEQNEMAILLHNNTNSFKIKNGQVLRFSSNIINKENIINLTLGVIQNNNFINLQTIETQRLNVTLNTLYNDSYLVLINRSNQKVKLTNCKIKIE